MVAASFLVTEGFRSELKDHAVAEVDDQAVKILVGDGVFLELERDGDGLTSRDREEARVHVPIRDLHRIALGLGVVYLITTQRDRLELLVALRPSGRLEALTVKASYLFYEVA